MSTTEQNVAIVQGFFDDVVNGGRIDLLDQYFAEDVLWTGGSLGERRGLAENKAFMEANTQGAFSGMHLDVKAFYPDGNTVVALFTNSGTHTGEFMGRPATGKHAVWNGVDIYTIVDGRIAEARFVEDVLAMLFQLGVTQLPTV